MHELFLKLTSDAVILSDGLKVLAADLQRGGRPLTAAGTLGKGLRHEAPAFRNVPPSMGPVDHVGIEEQGAVKQDMKKLDRVAHAHARGSHGCFQRDF